MVRKLKIVFLIVLSLFIINILLSVFYFYNTCHFINKYTGHCHLTSIVFFHVIDRQNKYRLSLTTIKELDVAIALFTPNQYQKIICVGGHTKRHESGSLLMKKYLEGKGVPGNCIIRDSLSYDTYTNWIEARKILTSNNIHATTIVSSPMHLYRIYLISNKDNFKLSFATFLNDYKNNNSIFIIWKDIQHEFVGILMYYLPDRLRAFILKKYRTV